MTVLNKPSVVSEVPSTRMVLLGPGTAAPGGSGQPVAGSVSVIYDAVRNGRPIHREFTITFGDDGGTLVVGETGWLLNPVTGELSN